MGGRQKHFITAWANLNRGWAATGHGKPSLGLGSPRLRWHHEGVVGFRSLAFRMNAFGPFGIRPCADLAWSVWLAGHMFVNAGHRVAVTTPLSDVLGRCDCKPSCSSTETLKGPQAVGRMTWMSSTASEICVCVPTGEFPKLHGYLI